MDIKDYHAHHAIGASGLKAFSKCPARYYADYLDPQRIIKPSTPAQQFGTAWHAAMFEPEWFEDRFVIIPEGIDRRTKEGKALYAELIATGAEPISYEDAGTIMDMVMNSRKHPAWQYMHSHGASWRAEHTIMETDKETGVYLKIRPDYSCEPCEQYPHGCIIDGKTTGDASPEAFGKDSWGYGYWIQAALYCDVYMMEHGTDQRPEFILWAQEKAAPYLVKPYRVTEDVLDYGRTEYRKLLPAFAECQRTGVWPGYGDEIEPLIVPPWAQREIDGDEFVSVEIVSD
jgi:hypothetical protein